ncbi:MAG: DUF2029 domain-containing protein [Anaerolineales bacterium]|nr:DUF2029 domain-containing protein [Anaerolineales bacterium]
MKPSSNKLLQVVGVIVTLALLVALFQWRAAQNLTRQNYYSSNFFVFWLSGKLILEDQSPYDASQWSNGHEVYGSITPREPTFLYPLPLAVFLTPLGLLTVGQAYFLWQWLSQSAIAIVVYFLFKRWNTMAHNRLLVPVMLFLLFFGPIYLSLQIGSLGPLTLLLIFGTLLLLDSDHKIAAGVLLACTMFKPPQGIMILLLCGLVFLLKKEWKAILGIAFGGFLLLLIGYIVDVNWISTFLQSSQAAFDRRLGVQSTVWSFSYLACGGDSVCYYALGVFGMLALLTTTGWYLWKNREQISNWQMFNVVLPVSFVATLYLWAYDQILYVLPIVWIIGTLVEKTKSYVFAIFFLIILDLFSFFALAQQAITSSDLWSLGTTLLVLIFLGLASWMKPKQNKAI